jgi:hypothetical protein
MAQARTQLIVEFGGASPDETMRNLVILLHARPTAPPP